MSNEFKVLSIEPAQEMLDAITTERKKGNGALQCWYAAFAAAPQPPALGGEPRSIPDDDESVSLEWADGHNTACDAWRHYLATLQAEIGRWKAISAVQKDRIDVALELAKEHREERNQLQARCDELEPLVALLKKTQQFVEAWDDDSQEWMDLSGDISNALSKPAGSEKV